MRHWLFSLKQKAPGSDSGNPLPLGRGGCQDEEKPILGSFFELAWYYTMPEKTVIGIFDGDPNEAIQCKHPFVQEAVTTWVKTPKEACYLTLHYFS